MHDFGRHGVVALAAAQAVVQNDLAEDAGRSEASVRARLSADQAEGIVQ